MKALMKRGIFPILALVMILVITNEIYMVEGKVDFIRLWMCVGIPFGMVRGRTFLAPFSLDLAYILGMLLMYFVICGFFGGFIAIVTIVEALLVIVNYTIHGGTSAHVSY